MNAGRSHARGDAFDVDGSVAPVTVLRLKTSDVGRIEKDVREKLASLRQAFPYAPVVVDVAALEEASALELPLHDLAERLRACQLNPLGAANLPPAARWNAAAAGMTIVDLATPAAPEPPALPPAAATPVEPAPAAATPVEPAPAAATPVEPTRAAATAPPAEATRTVATTPNAEVAPRVAQTLTVRQPVRSGQIVYAQHADLVVLAAVNPGAQVVADGHVHVYGPLRGRALAGARGQTDARVFCQALEAELVAIAGQYLVADAIPREHRGRPTQLWLDDGHFRLERL